MARALVAQFRDQRFAVAIEPRVSRRSDTLGLRRLRDGCVELALCRQTGRHWILRRDVGHVPVRPVADRGDGRAGSADQLADLPVADLGVVLDDPRYTVGLVLAFGYRRVARAFG